MPVSLLSRKEARVQDLAQQYTGTSGEKLLITPDHFNEMSFHKKVQFRDGQIRDLSQKIRAAKYAALNQPEAAQHDSSHEKVTL
ncbi:uncharacterized protein N7483_011117 [Penicillium malachiteum]|uniref:uncharacterized protein n=1 Tax=Penicillium malachiteum TaxID=1324776 RepID=UPI0025494807|nr:uncharacterized protein N7483_011117 [Penicillium malachiteum]KAJ5713936.1 hypothetical protein N7483_011117 [Penicillium malachiteum]